MSAFALEPRASPVGARWMSLHAPIAPVAGSTSACRTTPWNSRGVKFVDWYGCRKLMYVTYASVPSGEIAIAGKSGRSLAGEATPADVQLTPLLRDHITLTCSFGPGCVSVGVGPFDQARTIWSVAPAPVGAPFAMSTVGNEPSRAPDSPSNDSSPIESTIPVWSMCV